MIQKNQHTVVYVYDYTESPESALYVGKYSDVTKAPIGYIFRDDNDNIDWDMVYEDESIANSISYVFVKAEDNNAEEIFVIIAPES